MIAPLIQEVILQAALFSLPTAAVFITTKVLRFDDLSIEGSFGVGAGSAALLTSAGAPLWLTLPLCIVAGGLTGSSTALLHLHVGIEKMLSGLTVNIGLFSVLLATVGAHRCVVHQAHLPLTWWLIIATGALVTLGLLALLLHTPFGLFLHASGHNKKMVQQLGKNPAFFITAGLALAGALSSGAGALFCLHHGFFSVTGNIGVLITALASMMLGTLFDRRLGLALFVGSLLYQAAFAAILATGINPVWNNLLRALIIIVLCALRPSTQGKSC